MSSYEGWRRRRAGGRAVGRERRKAKAPLPLVKRAAGPRLPAASLLAQAQALDERPVGLDVAALEVIELAAALADEPQQATAGMEILDVRLEMLGKHVDALGKERDLHFGRAGVVLG